MIFKDLKEVCSLLWCWQLAKSHENCNAIIKINKDLNTCLHFRVRDHGICLDIYSYYHMTIVEWKINIYKPYVWNIKGLSSFHPGQVIYICGGWSQDGSVNFENYNKWNIAHNGGRELFTRNAAIKCLCLLKSCYCWHQLKVLSKD